MRLAILYPKRYIQYVSAILATLQSASMAMYMYWSSPILPRLRGDHSPIGYTVDDVESSWIVSSTLLGTIPGCIIAAWAVNRYGSKLPLLLSAIPLAIPWIVIAFTKSVPVLCISRFIGGIATAIVFTSTPIYVSEIADKDIRGQLGSLFNVLRICGSLYVLIVGPFISYTALALSCAVLPIVFLALFHSMPESPYHLMKMNKRFAARETLIRLSGEREDKIIESRLQEMDITLQYDMQNKSTLWEFFSNREYRKSLVLMAGLKTLQMLSGITAIESYIQTIIGLSQSSISPELSSVLVGILQFVSVMITGVIVDKVGRKILLIISTLGCALALIGEGVYFYLQDVALADVSCLHWLPAVGLMMYLFMNAIGIFTVPYVLLGEIFATNIKGIGVSVITFYATCLAFLVTKLFQPITTEYGIHVVFWIFSIICILGAVFVHFVLPETKGKSFEEIQVKLNPSRTCERNLCDMESEM